MIEMNWNNDERNTSLSKYLVDPKSDSQSRRKAFLGGWTRYLNNKSSDSLHAVSWVGLGMWCASILGDIPEERRKDIYHILLAQYVDSDRLKHWTDEQREEALRLVTEGRSDLMLAPPPGWARRVLGPIDSGPSERPAAEPESRPCVTTAARHRFVR